MYCFSLFFPFDPDSTAKNPGAKKGEDVLVPYRYMLRNETKQLVPGTGIFDLILILKPLPSKVWLWIRIGSGFIEFVDPD
jgi:hypothetical protein